MDIIILVVVVLLKASVIIAPFMLYLHVSGVLALCKKEYGNVVMRKGKLMIEQDTKQL